MRWIFYALKRRHTLAVEVLREALELAGTQHQARAVLVPYRLPLSTLTIRSP